MADAVRSRVIGGDDLKRALKELDEAAAETALRLAVKAGAMPIENAAEQKAPKKTRTLARSITTAIEADRNHAEAQIGPSGAATPYAAQKEFGGTITAKNARMLHWVDEDGQDHFAWAVTQQAQPYMRPAWDENIEEAEKKMMAVVSKLVEQAGQGNG
jgi:HK97 gp10 family phage protein